MSHCWGPIPFPVLTSLNYEDYKKGFDQTEFPASFRDAFVTCRRLGIAYLWIDCYCIIQSGEGSEHDWRTESARMKHVYASAVLNIGSTAASGPHDGLFRARSSSPEMPFCVAWRPRPSDQKCLYHVMTGYEGPQYLKLFDEHGLFTRGWIFQERLLANRMLHFAKSQMYWECSGGGQTLASEEHPEGMPAPRFKQNLYPWSLECSSSKLRNGKQSLQALWADLVSNYSELQLSFPEKDKLLAVGGIAERMADLLQDQYVAGMFARDLIMQLTWQVWRGRKRASRFRAPTWSWASSDGSISLPQSIGDATTTIEKANLQLSNPADAFGAIASASLRLRCRPMHAYLRPASADPYRPAEQRVQIGDEVLAWANDDDEELSTLPDRLFFVLLHVRIWADPSRDRALKLQEAVALRASGRDRGIDRFAVDYHGLVLRQHDLASHRRAGSLVRRDDQTLHMFDAWRKATDEIITIT
ncbi:hypothetical protein KC332_g9236 [Hortaea werneckii]|uniref:Heterokaryon incompatibility domain-containing protein n=2 Tax=Hortaea werneckii TaxID=91943 RepID=A0A3M7IEJ8_HORWE|nr:hypothetical protein KC358_g11009 [Hortaea werneckii]OTA37463.1 hypothetical protein BTJ68_02221 [Hortaea werneckii EXF-2000]KAI6843583.1 hypothetical protein KC350_g4871 [Hortaea werneckii]KAI6924003.1 hypothetical protein KC348_g9383 [Hortaea werneckii]KAI6932842.1 hypothetical protein KC341_g8723 [Hortaea werneckii]